MTPDELALFERLVIATEKQAALTEAYYQHSQENRVENRSLYQGNTEVIRESWNEAKESNASQLALLQRLIQKVGA
jgi:hypothetical protein